MREIKFRAWHKELKFLFNVDAMDLENKTVLVKTWLDDVKYEIEIFPFDEIILEQYTGLKDANGVEIYEGDIVEYDLWSCEVVYCQKTASFRMNKITYPENTDYENAYVFTIFNTPYNIKVINQIHENGEFLK